MYRSSRIARQAAAEILEFCLAIDVPDFMPAFVADISPRRTKVVREFTPLLDQMIGDVPFCPPSVGPKTKTVLWPTRRPPSVVQPTWYWGGHKWKADFPAHPWRAVGVCAFPSL
jgi:hypothetical protein